MGPFLFSMESWTRRSLMSPGCQYYESTEVILTLAQFKEAKRNPRDPLQSAPEEVWAVCVLLLQLWGIALAFRILPTYYFLLKYLQFLLDNPWQTFLEGARVFSGPSFYLTFGNIQEILMGREFFPDSPVS
jgi:hypothetical protein